MNQITAMNLHPAITLPVFLVSSSGLHHDFEHFGGDMRDHNGRANIIFHVV